jgi:deoxyribodipyrimidine photo-lyase
MYKKSLFWFRQDLRCYDNTGLIEAIKNSKEILPIFILDSHIVGTFWWLSDQKFWFIRDALDTLSWEIKKLGWEKVIVFHWKPEEVIPKLVKKYQIECIYTNNSYGTYWKKRDKKVAEASDCDFETFKDFLLAEPYEIEQRKVFTPFYKLWQKAWLDSTEQVCPEFSQLKTDEQTSAWDFIDREKHPYFTIEFWKDRFSKLPIKNYNDIRNNLDLDGTSRLSPYLRFWIFSVRQIYNKHLINWESPEKWAQWESYISELAWREFWRQILYNFPHTKNLEFQEKRRNITWAQDQQLFEKWCKWETGYPIVDAAMRQLNETNWMHGRARMVVASFLTKDLLIDWRLWEQYFKQKLLDYDEAVNLGNWQWGASVWADPKPLRIFSPLLQSEKFDKKAIYIRKYIPELQFIEPKLIHNPISNKLDYCRLLVDHSKAQALTKDIYRQSSIDFEEKKNSD